MGNDLVGGVAWFCTLAARLPLREGPAQDASEDRSEAARIRPKLIGEAPPFPLQPILVRGSGGKNLFDH